MKAFLLISVATLMGSRALSQDIINIKDGSTINGKVTEITDDQIKYKTDANPDGPVYVLNKTKISSIHYKNGSDDVFSQNVATQANDTSTSKVVNGYNTNPDPSSYPAIAEQGYPGTQQVSINNFPNNSVNTGNTGAGARFLGAVAGLGMFAIMAANSWNKVPHQNNYYRTNNCNNNHYRRWR